MTCCPMVAASKLSDVDHFPFGDGTLSPPDWKKKPSRPIPEGVLAVVCTVNVPLSQYCGMRIWTGRYCRAAGAAVQVSKFGTRSGAAPPCSGCSPTTRGANAIPPSDGMSLRFARITTGPSVGDAAVRGVAADGVVAAHCVGGSVARM